MESATIASLAVISAAAVFAPLLVELFRGLRIPGVVIEIGLGILIGPFVLALAKPDTVITGFAELGLTFLMFLAGYEIDLNRIRGRPLFLATAGFLLSLALAAVVATILMKAGFVVSNLIVALALTTTALGTLLPMLRDAHELESRFGTYLLAIGTVGEFGPVVAIALLLTTDRPAGTALLLVLFVLIAAAAAALAISPRPPRIVEVLQRNLHSSAQLPVRISLLLIVLLVWLASRLGLDVLLGAFAAGVVIRLFSAGRDAEVIRVKLEAIGFGFLVPIFFIVSGMRFDIDALIEKPATLLRLPFFLALFLVVRGLPALLLYRRDLPKPDLAPLALFSATALPLVVVITHIGTVTSRMRPANAAALVGAAMLSVLLFPLAGLALRRGRPEGAEGP